MNPIRTLVPLVLILGLATPITALAGPSGRHGSRGHDRGGHDRGGAYQPPAREGVLTVRNDNLAPLEVLVDGQVLGSVQGGDTARFAGLDLGQRRVRVRFNGHALRFPVVHEEVVLDGRHPARLVVPSLDTGLLVVNNPWVEPVTVLLNGRNLGVVAPGQRAVLKAEHAYGFAEVVTPSGALAMRARVNLRGLDRTRLAVAVPQQGSILVVNPSNTHALDLLCERGTVVATLPPGSSRFLQQPSGPVRLTAAYRDQRLETVSLLSSPFESTQWTIALPTRSTLGVRNPNRFPVSVSVDGTFIATVGAGEMARLHGVRVGAVTVSMAGEGRRGQVLTSVRLDIDPLSGGFLPIPEVFVRDGRGSVGSADAPRRGQRRVGSGRVYAEARR